MGFWSCLGGLALAVVAAPVVLPAAGAAAVAAGTAAAAGAATAATAVGSAAAAAGTMAAGAAATVGSAAVGAATAAGTMAAGAATAVGSTVAGAAGAVATKGALMTGAKVVGGVVGTGLVCDYVDTQLDKAEAKGRKQGFDHGFREGKIKAAEDLQKMLEKNENFLLGVFAMALYVAILDGMDDAELDYIETCLGNGELRSEAVRHEIQRISLKQYDFDEIKVRYLDKVTIEEIEYVDNVIQGVMDADGTVSEKERQFYVTTWQPYLRSLKKA